MAIYRICEYEYGNRGVVGNLPTSARISSIACKTLMIDGSLLALKDIGGVERPFSSLTLVNWYKVFIASFSLVALVGWFSTSLVCLLLCEYSL